MIICFSNVSKHNYCFSDFPFPDDVPDYPHNKDMAKYIKDYAAHFKLHDCIQFFTKVKKLEKTGKHGMARRLKYHLVINIAGFFLVIIYDLLLINTYLLIFLKSFF